MNFMRSAVLAVVVLVAPARAALAQVCVGVDASKDTLSEGERASARAVLASVVEANGQKVVPSGCAQGYTVHHLRLGNSITVFVVGPGGSRQATAARIEDLPALYDQMVKSLLSGQPMRTEGDSMSRANVTTTQAAPMRVQADGLWYIRLGYGAALSSPGFTAPALGFGYRYELDNVAIDASFYDVLLDVGDTNGRGGVTGSIVRLQGHYFFNGQANASTYLGAGVGWGLAAVASSTESYQGSGLEGVVTGGYEFLRASTIRMFLQADATLPFFRAKVSNYGTGSTADPIWTPSVVMSLGIGWGRGTNTIRVVN